MGRIKAEILWAMFAQYFRGLFPLVANNLELLVSIQKEISNRKEYKEATKRGARAIVRFSKLLKLSEIIANESKKH